MADKGYTVLNPRDIPKGTPILRRENKSWCEGDAFIKPKEMSHADVDGWVRRGFLEAV